MVYYCTELKTLMGRGEFEWESVTRTPQKGTAHGYGKYHMKIDENYLSDRPAEENMTHLQM